MDSLQSRVYPVWISKLLIACLIYLIFFSGFVFLLLALTPVYYFDIILPVELFLNTFNDLLYGFLYTAFLVYALRNQYQFLAVTVLILALMWLYSHLTKFWIVPDDNIQTLNKVELKISLFRLLILVHCASIVFTDARKNKWLYYHALVTAFFTLISGNILTFLPGMLKPILSFIHGFEPGLFIFLIRDELRKRKPPVNTDQEHILDSQTTGL